MPYSFFQSVSYALYFQHQIYICNQDPYIPYMLCLSGQQGQRHVREVYRLGFAEERQDQIAHW